MQKQNLGKRKEICISNIPKPKTDLEGNMGQGIGTQYATKSSIQQ